MLKHNHLAHVFSLIRTRLTFWIIVILAAGLLAFVITTLVIANQLLNHLNEKRLQQNVSSLVIALTQESGPSATLIQSQLNAFSVSDIYLQYQNQQGKPITSSTNMGRMVFPLAHLRPAIAAGRFAYLTLGSTSYYLYGQSIVIKGHLQGYLIAAHPTAEADSESLIFTLMYSGVFVMLTLIALLVWLLVRQTLRPLERLADSASHIALTHDHGLRVPVEKRADEINSLALTINGMLHSLEEAYQYVQKVNDLQRRFLADASHELRTPLTIMLSSLELMKKEQDPEFQTHALENLYRETERMARLTTRLLILARTDTSTPFVREPLLIVDILSEAYRQSYPLQRDITLECQGLETLDDAVVSGNADYLKQVFLVILENACKYTPDGGKVTVIGKRKGQELLVTITDTGIGIAQDDLSRLFERFYRAENARSEPGMGLGLSIALGIVEQHNGTIKVESTLGQGSCFIISLPLLNT